MRTGSGRKMHMFGCRNDVFHQKLIGSRQGRRWFFSLCLTARAQNITCSADM